MLQCFKTPDMGSRIFTFFFFSLFRNVQYVSVVLLYNLYVLMFRNTRYGVWNFHLFMLQCFKTPDMGSRIFTFLCFSLFRNVLKQLKVWTQRLKGELIVYPWSGVRRPSVHRPSVVCPQCSKIFFSEPLGRSKPNYMWSLLG